ncbi:MAG: hypothetical protein ACFFCW_12335 [Candidatus Hodarchaeota archaeon]
MKTLKLDLIMAVVWTIVTLYWIFYQSDLVGMILTTYSAIAFYTLWIIDKRKEDQLNKKFSYFG